MGLQYLVDRPELSRDRGRVFDEIADGTITIEKIESSDFYNKIEQRVHFLPLLEQMIDSNDTVFKYNKKANMYSMIEADYPVSYTHLVNDSDVFLSGGYCGEDEFISKEAVMFLDILQSI